MTMKLSAPLRRVLGAASWLACALPGAAAAADEVVGTRSEQLVERAHEIRLVLDHGAATLTVRRTVFNGGERHDQAEMLIELPDGAVATGLRTKGTLRGRPHWFEGELLEAELAAARYRELTGIGGYYPKDPALLSWRHPTLLALQVFPVAPQTDKTVEYTLQMPTSYCDGRDHVWLPELGTEQHPARVRLVSAHRRDQLLVDGEPVANGYPITLDEEHEVSLARHRPARIEARLASVPLASDRTLLHYDVALAPQISTIPRDARVVVVLDGSFSMTPFARKAAQATARAYLQHFSPPRLRARAEVLVFDRTVEARHGRLVSVREALADLDHLALPGANGSAVDEALVRAHALLEAAPDGPRRVLLLTDARTREELEPERLRVLAERSGAIMHVGIMEPGEPALTRDDDHRWASVATATGGLVWNVEVDLDEPREALRVAFEELARPLRIDHLTVSVPPLDDPQIPVPDVLDEGQGLEALALVDESVEHLRIEGELWSMPVRETVFPDATEGRRWAALAFGSEVFRDLTEEEMLPLALYGRAVSPVTSYLAIEPGVRPSTEGLDHGDVGLIGRGGSCGMGSGIGIGGGSLGFGNRDPRQELLERRVRAALDACGGKAFGVRVTLETTLDEIVEVGRVTVRGQAAADPVLDTCLHDGVWAIELSPIFADEWKRWVVDLPA